MRIVFVLVCENNTGMMYRGPWCVGSQRQRDKTRTIANAS